MTWGYLSFHWRYNVRNFGTFVSPLITILMLIATFSSREITPLPPALKSAWLPVLRTLRARHWTGGRLMVSHARKVFDEEGTLVDDNVRERLEAFVGDFIAFCERAS